MKRNATIIAAIVLVLGMATFSYAKYVSGFNVVEVSDKQVTIQKGEEKHIMVTVKKAGKYMVGDKVKYDAEKMKIRRAGGNDYDLGC